MTDLQAIEQVREASLLAFYGWWQLSVCLFAFLALTAIWWHIGRRQGDSGQIWLAFSVLCWSFSGAVEIYYGHQLRQESRHQLEMAIDRAATDQSLPVTEPTAQLSETSEQPEVLLDGWRSILSLFNSFFILFALPWFRYIPRRIEPLVKSRYWYLIVGLPFVFSLLPTITTMIFSAGQNAKVIQFDIFYALLTLGFLGAVLWDSFAKRRLQTLAWLSLICILITFVAQLYKLTDWYSNQLLLAAIFKTSLIMIFFALALSWVKELAENVIPKPQQLFLSFEAYKQADGRLEQQVLLKGLPGLIDRRITLTPALYELLLKFARRRVAEAEGWLEIKPKSEGRTGKSYDINDHNEIKRLLTALLDGIFGRDQWAERQHLQPLKQSLFERSKKRGRRVRLALPAENISLPPI